MWDISHYNKEVDVMKFNIEIYEKENGDAPFYTFLESIKEAEVSKILRDIDLLEYNGNRLREPFSKYLRDGIFELRSKLGNNAFRSIYYFVKGRTVVVTHCFQKKQNKTPEREIELALKYKEDWERRRQNEI